MGVECDWKSQVPGGSERGQQPQHSTLHLLDFVSRSFSPSCLYPYDLIWTCISLQILNLRGKKVKSGSKADNLVEYTNKSNLSTIYVIY